MNAGTPTGSCTNTGAAFGSDDTITFAASAISGATTPGTITLADSADASGDAGGTLVVTAAHLRIDGSAWRGSGANQYEGGVTIARPDGATHAFGVLRDEAPAGAMLVLEGVTLRSGHAVAGLCNGRADGGGICMTAADLTLVDSTVSSNQAENFGGGIASSSGAVLLTRSTLNSNVAYGGGGLHSQTGAVTIAASTISGNSSWPVGGGGGIRADGTLDVVDSTISENSGKRGAGIQSYGVTTLTRTVVSANQAYYDGGGIHAPAGTVTLTSSAIVGNFARYEGAGAHVGGVLVAINCTIAGNSGYRAGAGIFVAAAGTAQLDHATLSLNHSSLSGGGIGGFGSATIEQSIVSGNSAPDGGDIAASVAWTGGGNLVSSASDALGPLQDNGGPTPTRLPGAGSAAIDAIAAQDCTQSFDQRGFARPQGAGCDIGAVEVVVDAIFADGFD
ncbi:MAG TPA: choice-of-anchor Q domain-containing protein [Dokdonella sp.]|nr:choice-of-anchor Q domain-containing protein [Dokdonella sp.]